MSNYAYFISFFRIAGPVRQRVPELRIILSAMSPDDVLSYSVKKML